MRERETLRMNNENDSFARVMIKMRNLLNQNGWYWDDVKFVNRSFIIKVRHERVLGRERASMFCFRS